MGVCAMRSRLFAALSALCLFGLVGCGGSETAAPVAATPGTSGATPSDPVARVVFDFFDAVRQGNTAAAHQFLTPLSLQRITALDMNIAPPGSATASFQVGKV